MVSILQKLLICDMSPYFYFLSLEQCQSLSDLLPAQLQPISPCLPLGWRRRRVPSQHGRL
ncbi:Hypothetical protein FKW44_000314 [Caligus rogercresseyi]|uniref:Uncharacterized protein n=1 Tax=Caligus rogercresseyi TaxID=217165 RepID=A0A7T8KHF9_CALRO|nr:Hypothetical protein FKW44_000314 [Caligus rogercresseyi]